MSITADMSLMDILFDRDDPILKFGVEEKDLLKPDFDDLGMKSELLSDKIDGWNTNEDDFLSEILREEPFSMLEDRLGVVNNNNDIDMSLTDWKQSTNNNNDSSSRYSDTSSNDPRVSPDFSNDYQFSPTDEDEIFSSAVSSASDSSNIQTEVIEEEQVEMDGSIFDVMDSNHSEDSQAVLNIQTEMKQTEKKKVKQVIKTTPVISSNSRSVLLPVITGNTVTTYKIVSSVNGFKTLKPINRSSNQILIKNMKPVTVPLVIKNNKVIQNSKKVKQIKQEIEEATDEDEEEEDDEVTVVSDSEDEKIKSQYPRLILSAEEKKLMLKEGVTLPTHYPLTKFEERELKRIRRKIRNKISAQDSRKRKKEYLDGLEDRVKQCTEENLTLVKKIKMLQTQNQSLMMQLKKLQNTLTKTTTKTAQPATCLMVLMLSVALVMAPNLRLTQNKENEVQDTADNSVSEKTLPPIGGRSRALLYSKTTTAEECTEDDKLMGEMQEMLEFHNSPSPVSSPNSVTDSNTESLDDYYREKTKKRKTSLGEGSSGYDTDNDNPHYYLVDHDYEPPPGKRRRFSIDSYPSEKYKVTGEDEYPMYGFDSDEFGLSETEIVTDHNDNLPNNLVDTMQAVAKNLGLFDGKERVWTQPIIEKPKELLIPDIDDEWVPRNNKRNGHIDELTTEVKVNISDSKGTRTVVIQVPKEKK